MSESNRNAAFSCYLGDGEFDYVEIPLATGDAPTELGAAVDHFIAKYPNCSWRMYERGNEDASPLYEYPGPEERKRLDAEHAEWAAGFALWLATV